MKELQVTVQKQPEQAKVQLERLQRNIWQREKLLILYESESYTKTRFDQRGICLPTIQADGEE